MLITAVAIALLSVALFFASRWGAPVWVYYLILLGKGVVFAIGWPARSALMPQLLPTSIFAQGMAWNSMLFQVASATGPALGGIMIEWLFVRNGMGVAPTYLFTAACVAVYVVLIAMIPGSFKPKPAARAVSRVQELFAGITWVARNKVILAALMLDFFAVLFGGVIYLLPVFAEDILKVGGTGLGFLRAADPIGAFVMALLLAWLPPMKHAGRNLLLSVAGFGVCMLVFAFSQSVILSFVVLLLSGAFDAVSVVVRHTLVQTRTPDAMRGRVSAVNNVFIGSSNELGGLESSVTAHFLGPRGSVVLGGIGTLVAVGLIGLIYPQIGRLKRLDEPAEQNADGRTLVASLSDANEDRPAEVSPAIASHAQKPTQTP